MGFIKTFAYKHVVYLDYIYTYVRHVRSLYFPTCTFHVLTLFARVVSSSSPFSVPFIYPDNFDAVLMTCTRE